ncbi:TldD/PmbA family protein [Clostridium niameyense]|uniref:TldD/PmbA family protein n=1 Tax=Clostridium niameyense TaxID=1622073 RepID=A0A6M0R9L8_9CLOT|nr:TldD/PmbA family protein [Clostridium niameyense]NEZ46961.1 TldD/PmbA family protein [Clostridium niameyense]
MEIKTSKFLTENKTTLKKLVSILSRKYKYVSILGTDSLGKSYTVQKTGISLGDSFWNERGFVLRVYNDINYSEFSFNEIDKNNIEIFAENIINKIDNQLKDLNTLKNSHTKYPIIEEDFLEKNFYGKVQSLSTPINHKEILEKLTQMKNKALDISNLLVDFVTNVQTVHVSKIFTSPNRNLEQSYVWSESYLISTVRRDSNIKSLYKSFSGLKGFEILNEMENSIKDLVNNSIALLDSSPVIPGEYDVICSPDVSGLIAHEAFGHGVEMDMFTKNRAKAKEYINKKVASNLVSMRDGAQSYNHVSSYLFDDEGNLGSDTLVIDKGILVNGFSDTLSALSLNIKPTGNGKRESFERKAYARMTNTFFEAGKDTLEDMIASIKHGYLLECPSSGMEDPKNWGIQCMVDIGREIKDGKFTGRIVSPVILTGYVPDVLNSISMVSNKLYLEGSGACGKGYKEYVKVSSGGPYIKAKVRLG